MSQYPIAFSKKNFKVMFSFQAKFFDQEIAKLTCRTNWTKFIDFGTFNKAPAIENNIQRWSKKLINTRSVKNPNTSRPLDQHYQKNSLKHKTDLNTRAGFANFTLPFGFTLVFFMKPRFKSMGVLKDIMYKFGELNILIKFRKLKRFTKSQREPNNMWLDQYSLLNEISMGMFTWVCRKLLFSLTPRNGQRK